MERKRQGLRFFKINEDEVDSGDIFGQKTIPIGEDQTTEDIYPKICQATLELFLEYLQAFHRGNVKFTKQDNSQASYTCKRTPADGEINWQRSACEVYNFIKALTPPYPYAWTKYQGEIIKIKKISLPKTQIVFVGNIPGRVVAVQDEGVRVTCGQGQIVVHEVIRGKEEVLKANQIFTSMTTLLGR